MIDDKSWYASRTIWGGIVALGGALAGLFGLTLGPAEGETLTLALTDAATAIGAVLAILGRLDATRTIR